MEKFVRLTAVAVPVDMDNVDTDQIIPARFMRVPRLSGNYGQFLLHDHRHSQTGGLRTEFSFNDPAFQNATIIVAGRNYGCGSSRLGAAYVHLDYGVRAIIAAGFGEVFARNCNTHGVLCAALEDGEAQEIRSQLHSRRGSVVTVDLQEEIVIAPDQSRYQFKVDPFARQCLLGGVDEIGLTLESNKQFAEFEAAYKRRRQWSFDALPGRVIRN